MSRYQPSLEQLATRFGSSGCKIIHVITEHLSVLHGVCTVLVCTSRPSIWQETDSRGSGIAAHITPNTPTRPGGTTTTPLPTPATHCTT